MSLAPTPRFLAAGGLVLAAYAVWLLPALWMAASNRDRLVMAGMVVAPLLVAWKHGYTRADGHVLYFVLRRVSGSRCNGWRISPRSTVISDIGSTWRPRRRACQMRCAAPSVTAPSI